MVLERPLDYLVKEIGGQQLMDVSPREVSRKWLLADVYVSYYSVTTKVSNDSEDIQ